MIASQSKSNSLKASTTSNLVLLNKICYGFSDSDGRTQQQKYVIIEHTASKVQVNPGGVRIHMGPGSSKDSLFFTQYKMMGFLVLGVYLIPLTQQHAYRDRGGKIKDFGLQLRSQYERKKKFMRAGKIMPSQVQ